MELSGLPISFRSFSRDEFLASRLKLFIRNKNFERLIRPELPEILSIEPGILNYLVLEDETNERKIRGETSGWRVLSAGEAMALLGAIIRGDCGRFDDGHSNVVYLTSESGEELVVGACWLSHASMWALNAYPVSISGVWQRGDRIFSVT